MRHPLALALVLTTLGTAPALAQDMPSWDVAAQCQGQPGGFRDGCARSAAENRRKAEMAWPKASKAIRGKCLAKASEANRGERAYVAYSLLDRCLAESR